MLPQQLQSRYCQSSPRLCHLQGIQLVNYLSQKNCKTRAINWRGKQRSKEPKKGINFLHNARNTVYGPSWFKVHTSSSCTQVFEDESFVMHRFEQLYGYYRIHDSVVHGQFTLLNHIILGWVTRQRRLHHDKSVIRDYRFNDQHIKYHL